MRRPPVFALTLAAACGGPATLPPAAPTPAGSQDLDALALGATVAGALTEDQPRDRWGAFGSTYRLDLSPGERARLRLRSPAFDPVLEVHGPTGTVRNDDAFPGTGDAWVELAPPGGGTFEVRVTSALPDRTGPFELRAERARPGGVGRPLDLGTTVDEVLGRRGDPDLPGSWFRFRGQPGAVVRFRVTSRSFDTVATLLGPDGVRWTNDDAQDLGPDGAERAVDSTLVAALPGPGVYQLVVTSFGPGAGPFRVRSELRPPVVLTEGEQPLGVAGSRGGGRILGLYVGITDYGGRQPELYGCADDARFLAAAMRASHLQRADEQLVLPDGLATRDNVLRALAQIARRAGSKDVVLIFYSGHGAQQAAPEGSPELDGLDETLILRDGPLTDDELAQALGPIRADALVVAIDACNAGGFADDLITRPDRIGIFSSDEDVLSDTAPARRAGGYLAWHLREAVLGDADHRPRDGLLTAGELTDRLHRGFVADQAMINPPGTLEPDQRLVVRRGGVPWTQALWVYPRRPDLTLFPRPELDLRSATP